MEEQDVRTPPEQPAAEAEAKRPRAPITLKVSEKGGLSVYGLGRFPVTLYKEQWLRLLEQSEPIRNFIREHDHELKKKEV
jgi:hypothetical protein